MADTPYVTVDQVKEDRPALVEASNDEIEALVARFEEVAEDYLGISFVPRTATQPVHSSNGLVRLWWPMLRSITSMTDDGITSAEVPAIIDAANGIVAVSARSPYAPERLLTYTHGYEAPPQVIIDAAIGYVDRAYSAKRAGTSRDVLSQTFDGGTTRYSTPSKKDRRPTGFLDVDDLLNSAPTVLHPGLT